MNKNKNIAKALFEYTMHSGYNHGFGTEIFEEAIEDHDEFKKEAFEYFDSLKVKFQKKYNRPVQYQVSFKLAKFVNEAKQTENLPDIENKSFFDYEDKYNEKDFPRGWKNRNKFVARDGSYFEKGELIKEKYRTEEPSEYKTKNS